MKRTICLLAFGLLSIFTFQHLRAQDDQGAPPPPMDQDQGAPPPQDQGATPQDQGDQGDPGDVTYQTFYDNLNNQGTWVQTDNYGYVFQPQVSDPNWAPYTDGHWAYTEWGWMWVSDEPWGWATYHYGRWVNLDGMGWVWVPGYRWAPAWVSWRYGDGYCGWAPLPPDTLFGVEYGGGAFGGYHFGSDVDSRYHIGAGYYNFVKVGRMGDPNMRGAIVNRYRNYGIINRTTNVTALNVGARGGRGAFGNVQTGGPNLNVVNAAAGNRIRTLNVTAASRPGVSSVNGNSVSVFAPHINGAKARQGRPASVSQTLSHSTVNRGTNISDPMAVNSRVRPAAPTQSQIRSARTAQAHAASGVATGGTVERSNAGVGAETHTSTSANHTFTPSTDADSAFRGGEPTTHTAETPAVSHTATGSTVHHHHTTASTGGYGSTEHTSAYEGSTTPAVHHTKSASTFHPQESHVEHHESAPVFHQSAPVSHAAEQPHFSGGGGAATHASSPAMHAGGGGGGGGHPGGGGGGGGHPAAAAGPAGANKKP